MSDRRLRRTHFYAPRLIALGFAAVILLGAGLLSTPWAASDGKSVGFFSALFTATSAVCVTGLTVVEAGRVFSLFGQVVLLCLIQIGGLGFVTILALIFTGLKRRITLHERMLIQEAMNENNIGGMVRLIRWVIRLTALCEGAGAILLSVRFVGQFGWARGIYYGIFHSVSAFCNAGFDVLGNGDSLCAYVKDPLVCLTLCALILTGGLGFGVIRDILDRRKGRRLCLHTKLVLFMTGLLLLIGTALTLLSEWSNPETLGKLSVGEKLLAALFQSVTFRTAGFATISQGNMRPFAKFAGCALMLVGAAPASTGGGIKVTTLAVLMAMTLSTIRGMGQTRALRRAVPEDIVRRAASIAAVGLAVLFADVALIALTNPDIPFIDSLFECASALGTAGLTAAGTGQFSPAARVILMLTMFIGRIGPLSLTIAVAGRQQQGNRSMRLPEERVIVG